MARSKYEIKAQKSLEKEGYLVDNKAGMSRWSANRDFWHLFDLVAIKKGKKLRYIAIKGHGGGYSELREKLKVFWMPKSCIKELWRYTDTKKGLKIEIIP